MLGALARKRTSRERGAALLMVLSVIAVLALLVTAFASITRLERQASQNNVDLEKARFIALSGVERAKYEVRRAVLIPGYPVPWLRYERNWYDNDACSDGTSSTPLVPPLTEEATQPSFMADVSTAAQALNPTTGPKPPVPSGFLGASYYEDPLDPKFFGDYYTLKITDNNARIYLNDANPHLRDMLDTVATVVTGDPTPGVGARILAARDKLPGGFRDVSELQEELGEDLYNKLAPYLTCQAWVNTHVIECGWQLSSPDTGSGTLTKRDPGLHYQPRAPINMNLASYPVLVAVLRGVGYKDGPSSTWTVDLDTAKALAKGILSYRKQFHNSGGSHTLVVADADEKNNYGFTSWGEFYHWLLTTTCASTLSTDPTVRAIQASAVLANCNPNTDLNKLVPDLGMYRLIDKTDLTDATTEFCFNPGGVFTIESVGTVLGKDGKVVASAKVRSVVRVYERYHETSQLDFETDRVKTDVGKGAAAGTDDVTRPGSSGNKWTDLRDITTLPGWRNQGRDDALTTDLEAATYDGQIVFNAISEEMVAEDQDPDAPQRSCYFGFIGPHARDLQGFQPNETIGDAGVDHNGTASAAGTGGAEPTGFTLGAGQIRSPDLTQYSVVGGSKSLPNFESGSDLLPHGCFLGRGARDLRFDQAVVMNREHRVVPKATISIGHAGSIYASEAVAEYDYFAVDAEAFEFWIKPDFDAVDTTSGTTTAKAIQPLLRWESAKQREPALSYSGGGTVSAADIEETISEVDDINKANYLTAVKAGGPKGQPILIHPPGGSPIPDPDPSLWLNDPVLKDYNGDFPYESTAGPPDPTTGNPTPSSNPDDWVKRATDLGHDARFAQILHDYYLVEYTKYINESLGGVTADSSGMTWGTKGYVEVDLVEASSPDLVPRYSLKGKVRVDQKTPVEDYDPAPTDPASSPAGPYKCSDGVWQRTFDSGTNYIRPGTWHHVLINFWAIQPSGNQTVDAAHHAAMFIDTKACNEDSAGTTTPGGDWPKEIHVQARFIDTVLKNMLTQGFGPIVGKGGYYGPDGWGLFADYNMPVQLPAELDGDVVKRPILVGFDGDALHYRGLIDNLIFQGSWPKNFNDSGTLAVPDPLKALRRNDRWRPSLGHLIEPLVDDPHLYFTKRTTAMEWDRPITIAGYCWTAWIHSETTAAVQANLDMRQLDTGML